MSHLAYSPVGYGYRAANYCLDCIPKVTGGTVGYRGDECNCAECQLDRIAAVRGIVDRMDERSFDMDYFPKSIPYHNDIHADCGAEYSGDGEAHCYQRCDRCGEVIDGPCPALPDGDESQLPDTLREATEV